MRLKLDLLHPDLSLSQTVRTRQGAKKEAHDRSCREIMECGATSVCPQPWIRSALVRRKNTEIHGSGLVQSFA